MAAKGGFTLEGGTVLADNGSIGIHIDGPRLITNGTMVADKSI